MSDKTAGWRHYLTIGACYWGFTLSDGAVRMLVLFYFFQLGYTPFQLASLFVFYELAGMFANLIGGWLATRFGLRAMLAAGVSLQIVGLLSLSVLQPGWAPVLSVVWVVLAQGLCGVAKDLTKTASKAAIKIVGVSSNQQMFSWVAWFTGSKNAVKGIGFFVGGLGMAVAGFAPSLWTLAVLLAGVLLAIITTLPAGLGQMPASKTVAELFSKSSAVNLLAAARVFLFGARDIWFVVGIPVYFYETGWPFWQVGSFLAVWTVFYGVIQGFAPRFIRRSDDGLSAEIPAARITILLCAVVPLVLGLWAMLGTAEGAGVPLMPVSGVVAGLFVFAVLFALNSSLHSYLILAYAGSKKVAEDVGFYYAANAAGRLAGTLLSGLCYGAFGLAGCLLASFVFLFICTGLCWRLPARAS